MKINILFSIIIFPFAAFCQGGIFIESGANMVLVDQAQLVVNDGRFRNDGDFSAGNSTVHMTGSALTENSTIGGTTETLFNHLRINKSNHDVRLDYDIELDGNLSMKSGDFILNYSDVILGGDIVGEKANKRITGTDGGAIFKTVNLNMPSGENPGNLGIEITSSENLGSTTIRRSHVQMTNNGNESIYRHYDISPANNSGLDATLKIYYFDDELNSLPENQLDVWQFDGMDWSQETFIAADPVNNWVEASGFSFLHTLTLAEEMNFALPIELLDFQVRANDQNEVDIYWETSTEVNNDYFQVERSKDGLSFEPIAIVDGAGNSSETLRYDITDSSPFLGTNYYRLKQVDFDGSSTFSVIRSATIDAEGLFQVYPNPMNEVLHLSHEGKDRSGHLTMEIFNALGQMVYTNHILLEGEITRFDIHEVSTFEAGNYILNLRTPNETKSVKLTKVH